MIYPNTRIVTSQIFFVTVGSVKFSLNVQQHIHRLKDPLPCPKRGLFIKNPGDRARAGQGLLLDVSCISYGWFW